MTEPNHLALAPGDQSLMVMGLGGAKYGINFSREARSQLHAAIVHLHTCAQHGGAHHFAVTDEGSTLWCSETALACLNAAGVLSAELVPGNSRR